MMRLPIDLITVNYGALKNAEKFDLPAECRQHFGASLIHKRDEARTAQRSVPTKIGGFADPLIN